LLFKELFLLIYKMEDLRNSINDMRASGKLSSDRVGFLLLKMCDLIEPVPVPVPVPAEVPVDVAPEPVPVPEETPVTEAPVVVPQEDEEEEPEAPQEPGEDSVVKTPKKKRAKSAIVA